MLMKKRIILSVIRFFAGKKDKIMTTIILNGKELKNSVLFLTWMTKKHIILIQDGAKYHTSAEMRRFFNERQSRLTVCNLPSYSPDYNPIEKLWKKEKEEGTHLHYFPTYQDLVEKVEDTLVFFKNTAKEILSLFGFYDDLTQTV